MVKMFFSVFGQTPKHMFLTVFGSASNPPPSPYPLCVFRNVNVYLGLVKNTYNMFLLFL